MVGRFWALGKGDTRSKALDDLHYSTVWAVVGVCFGYVNGVLGLFGECKVLERLVVLSECGG